MTEEMNKVLRIEVSLKGQNRKFLFKCPRWSIKSGRVGAALVDRDLVRQAMLPNGFPEKAQSGLLVAVGRQQEVNGLAIPVDSTIEVFPLALDLDVGFVCSPALADRALVAFPENGLPLRREFLNSALDVGMVNFDPTLAHHFLQVPIAERVSQIPADAGQNDGFFDAVAKSIMQIV
jgi:hypothetical protein